MSRGSVVWQSIFEREANFGFNILEDLEGEALSQDRIENPAFFPGPLVVIVNHQNSSAGEIAALALKDLGRATIVGENTSGNVEAVRGFDLPDGSLVMVAVANVEGITGTDFAQGVTPDIYATETLEELSRGYDAPVAEALRVLKALPFTPGKFF